MQWSQLKKRVEAQFAPSLHGRVQVWITTYRHTHDREGRGWLTVDGREIWNMATLRAWAQQHDLAAASLTAQLGVDWEDWAKVRASPVYWERWHAMEDARRLEGFFTKDEFTQALWRLLHSDIEIALVADNVLLSGLATLDRRLGKRRFERFAFSRELHPFVRLLLELRAHAQGWDVPPVAA